MKITIQKKNLEKVVASAARAAASEKSTLAVLAGIKLEAKEGKLIVSATDYTIGLLLETEATVEVPGAVVVSKKAVEVFKKLPDGEVSLAVNDSIIEIKAGKSKFQLSIMDAKEFPSIQMPSGEGILSLSLAGNALQEAIKKVVFSAGEDESRPVFTGAVIDLANGCLVATNTHRLAKYAFPEKGDSNDAKVNIPAMVWEQAYGLFQGKEKVSLTWNKSLVLFTAEGIQLVGRLIEGAFPDYQKVIPKVSAITFISDVHEILSVVDRISLVAKSNQYNHVRMTLEGAFLTVSASNPDVGKSEETIAITDPVGEIDISFNSKYLIDGLKAIGNGQVLFKLNAPLSPALMVPVEQSGYEYLVTPVRTAS